MMPLSICLIIPKEALDNFFFIVFYDLKAKGGNNCLPVDTWQQSSCIKKIRGTADLLRPSEGYDEGAENE